MSLIKVIYFHGGPGFNGNPERHLLVDLYRKRGFDLRIWDEPSARRPNGAPFQENDAFQNLVKCAEAFFLTNYTGSPVLLMGHSFGAFPVCYISQRHPDKLSHVILISTDLCLPVTDKNTFESVMRDFRDHGDARHLELQAILDRYTGRFDRNTEEGFGLAVQNPRLFEYYWFNKDRMLEFLKHYSEPDYGIDIQAFLSVRRSFFELPGVRSPVSASAVFGAHEMLVSRDVELPLIRNCFSNPTVRIFPDSAHYPHIEEANDVLKLIEELEPARE